MVDKQKVLNRLATRETASVVGVGVQTTVGDDLEKATLRMIKDLGIPILQAKFALAKLVKHMQGSDLTINFEVHKFFNSKPKGKVYLNQFEKGASKWGGDSYITLRNEAEEAMFDYSGAHPIQGVPREVTDRVKHVGKFDEVTFEPATRPKYGALNYACLLYGAAGQWGRSHMVLKEHVKHTATYVHSDSFDFTGSPRQNAAAPGMVSTFFNLNRVIVNMNPTMFQAAWDAANGKRLGTDLQVAGLSTTSYVEGHVHGEIRYDRDVAKIVISISELNEAHAKTQLLKSAGRPFKVRDPDELEKVFRKFADKHSIPVVMA